MSKSKVTVKKDDVGKFLKTVRGLQNYITVGIQGSDADKDHGGINMVVLGTIHEFGAPAAGIPQRSFLRATFDEKANEYKAEVFKIGERAVKTRERADLRVLGEKIRGAVIERMRSNIPPPLAAATIARKGSDTALIDTGALLRSISVQIRKFPPA